MPKIIINEVDNTKAGKVAYKNFSVVVPGFVKYDDDDDPNQVFDENGIYEVSTQDDFEENVGKVIPNFRAKMTTAGKVGARPRAIFKLDPSIKASAALDRTNSSTLIEPDQIWYNYAGKETATREEAENNYRNDYGLVEGDNISNALIIPVFKYRDREHFNNAMKALYRHSEMLDKLSAEGIANTFNDPNGNTCVDLDNSFDIYVRKATTTDVGYLADGVNKFVQVSDEAYKTETSKVTVTGTTAELDSGISAEYNFAADTDNYGNANEKVFWVIYEGQEGSNGLAIVEDVIHYGNQIAWELLGLGYTVLYKRMKKNFEPKDFGFNSNEIVAEGEDITFTTGEGDLTSKVVLTDNNTFTSDGCREFLLSQAKYIDGDMKNELYNKSMLDQLSDFSFWECLTDKSTYDFRYVVTGLTTNNADANNAISQLATFKNETVDEAIAANGRGDCIALVDIDTAAYSGAGRNNQTAALPYIGDEINKLTRADKFTAIFAPCVTYTMSEDADYGNNRTFPGSFHYLACASNAFNRFNEWYAVAGLTRGVSPYAIESTGVKLGEIAIQALEPRYKSGGVGRLLKPVKDANGENVVENGKVKQELQTIVPERSINLIVKIKESYYLWGNRTAHQLGAKGASDGELVASHFLNIRQLCCTIKKQVYVACRKFTFDPNSMILWQNFCDAIRPTLDKMKADQGIKDYAIVQTATSKKALLKAKIRIVPIEAVEDFEITLSLEDSLSGTAVIAEE